MYEHELVFLDTCELERAGFCDGCIAVKEEADIHYSYCPADGDMCSEACIRFSDVQEICEELDKINKNLNDICADNRRMGSARDDNPDIYGAGMEDYLLGVDR